MIANLLQVVTYSSAISSAQEAGAMWKLGLQYLIDMKTLDLQGNLISYNSMIAAYAMSDMPSWHLALQSLEEVKQQMRGDIITSAWAAKLVQYVKPGNPASFKLESLRKTGRPIKAEIESQWMLMGSMETKQKDSGW